MNASSRTSGQVYCVCFGINVCKLASARISSRRILERFFLALVIAIAAWIIEGIFGKQITPFGRGIVGFLVSALVIWAAQFVVSNVSTSIIGAILAALVIGIIDLFIPVKTPFEQGISGREDRR